jgi:hypothetical protein
MHERTLRRASLLVLLPILAASCTAHPRHKAIKSDPAQRLKILWAQAAAPKGTTSTFISWLDGSVAVPTHIGYLGDSGPPQGPNSYNIAVSPDGRFIARFNQTAIEVASSTAPEKFKRIVSLKGNPSGVLWAPDSSVIAYRTSSGFLDSAAEPYKQSIWLVRRDGSGRRALRSDKAFFVPQRFDIAHKRLFTYKAGGGADVSLTAVSTVDGRILARYGQLPPFGNYDGMVYSRNFTAVYYIREFADTTHPRLYRFDFKTRKETVVRATYPNGTTGYIGGPISGIPGTDDLIVGNVTGPFTPGAGPGNAPPVDYRLDTKTGSLRLVFANTRYPCKWGRVSVSPDGRYLLIDTTAVDTCLGPSIVNKTQGNVLVVDIFTRSFFTFFEPTRGPCPTPTNGKPGNETAGCGAVQESATVFGWLVAG